MYEPNFDKTPEGDPQPAPAPIKVTMVLGPLAALLRSRKVMIAALGVVQTIVLHYAHVDPEVWASIDALLLAVIVSIASEDVAAKRAQGNK